ncbi:signal peptidase I [Streptomyces sp. NBC_01476]|uniref:signal peptidase I n=1 Tax=Streptomyces sp. NBC_01476 TaxID=2903881 RepID=UPI002E36DF4A|nr:signal peptidase I [Streptomyces sp. NBC_01476]
MSSSTSTVSGAIRRDGGAGTGRRGRTLSGLVIALGCVLFLGGFAWAAVVYRPYTVPTDSMKPTVSPGDKVLAQHISGDQVRRGDVVVFQDKLWGDMPEVKRVVGVGGDVVSCCDKQGRLLVNGKPVTEDYLAARGPASLEAFRSTVPQGKIFLLGDNRNVSQDSRVHLEDAQQGAVPADDVKARVAATAWPAGRMGMLPRTSAFDGLPGGDGQSSPGPLEWLVYAVIVGAVLILGGAAYEPLAKLARRR